MAIIFSQEKSGGADLVTSATALLKISGSASYTEDEKKVLRLTSTINGREYVPFMAGDLQERFAYSMPFSDRHGKLALSPKQQRSLARWARPDEISADPKIIENVDCFSIKQTVVSDCSFVASLAVSAQYEKRYHKRLITNIIYPQNRNGNPVNEMDQPWSKICTGLLAKFTCRARLKTCVFT